MAKLRIKMMSPFLEKRINISFVDMMKAYANKLNVVLENANIRISHICQGFRPDCYISPTWFRIYADPVLKQHVRKLL